MNNTANEESSMMDKLAAAFHLQSINTEPRLRRRSNSFYRNNDASTSSSTSSLTTNNKKRDSFSSLLNDNAATSASSSIQPATARKGRVIKRLSTGPHNPHGNCTTNIKVVKETATSIEPFEMGHLLDSAQGIPLLIDMRSLEEYEKSHIIHSINVNIPSLLLKRYRRGVVSNFNLESFITTPEGLEYFKSWEGQDYIVYDQEMKEDAVAWTLLNVLIKQPDTDQVFYLKYGYSNFETWDFTCKYITTPDMPKRQTPKLKMPPTPMISRSATTLSTKPGGTNVHRRASLFSLDTTLRSTKSTTAAASRLTSLNEQPTMFNSNHSPTTPATNMSSPDVFHTPMENFPMKTPQSESEFDFVISEIIPHFLYLGPEIANVEQLTGLSARLIKRILNMAEECDDDVPGLKARFHYTKVAARDTVEMQNVEGTLRKAVQAIEDAKKHHEPIYVHCKAGKSRSAAAILAYLVLVEHWTLKRAYRHIVKARPNISPNIGFVAELMKLEQSVHGQVSNFAGTDWHLIDPPSPDTQKEMGRLEKAWRRKSSSVGHKSSLREH